MGRVSIALHSDGSQDLFGTREIIGREFDVCAAQVLFKPVKLGGAAMTQPHAAKTKG